MIDIDIQISISERSSGWATNYHDDHHDKDHDRDQADGDLREAVMTREIHGASWQSAGLQARLRH